MEIKYKIFGYDSGRRTPYGPKQENEGTISLQHLPRINETVIVAGTEYKVTDVVHEGAETFFRLIQSEGFDDNVW